MANPAPKYRERLVKNTKTGTLDDNQERALAFYNGALAIPTQISGDAHDHATAGGFTDKLCATALEFGAWLAVVPKLTPH